MPGVRGFERAHSSRAGDEGTTMEELDNWPDGPWADGPWAGRPWAMQLQAEEAEEDQVDNPPTDRGKSHGSAERPTDFLV